MKLQIQEDRIEKQIHINAPIPRVWRALTDHHEFEQWFRVKIDGPFVVGQTSHGQITVPGYEHVKWEAVVQEIDAERFVFAYSWHPYAVEAERDYAQEPSTRVEFRLQPSGDGTLLSVTESGFSKLPADRLPEAFRMNSEGWSDQMENVQRHAEQNS
ncbi:MAG: SRPBCC family protein [Chthoniobacterales bacterium]|nr:SRPBCC family protein [Chthoniobacterales bacterium]